MTTSGARVKTNDNEWYNEWQRMAKSGDKWQRVTQRVTTNIRVTVSDSSGQLMKTAQYTSKNGWLMSCQWEK